ncbi:uncharacterized protein LOC126851958 [Cataglyphis hispanica]|uniref:uncharacterized protein LOC126851958 n=1 Tax=Cataglyphis hispanica TaxID=1086592 RepID=UPI00217F2D61|nr:uncharacterized protein LOC126851958 [Cataglyphis hispanica]XP_050452300.1 uncharacterized protein LOC126851958 [Cataglyphis hispanica]
MNETSTRWCFAPGCMLNIKIAKRHFFRFPKERERWLEWIKACNRMDLETIGPEYANQYYRLCHLHFRVEMFRNIEGRIYLKKEAVPSIFLKPIQTGNNKSTDLLQPISFVTIFLKPESRTRNSSSNMTTQLSLTHPIKTDERDTTVISPLQVLFPRASIKQVYEDRNTLSVQTTLLKEKSENDNENIPKPEVQLVREVCTDLVTPTSSRISPECDNGDIIDLTSTDSLVATTSKTVSVHAIPQNGDRTPKRRRWHISTQTPEAWIYIDSFLKKRRIENLETHIDNQVAKRSKMLYVENEDHCAKVDQFKAACADLLPRNYALLVSAFINAREKRKAKKNFADRQSALEFFLIASGAYRFYRPLCLLPTVRQLWRHIRNWDIPPGLNDNVFNALHLKMKSLPSTERLCCLCIGEMRLRPYLFYNLSRDRIIGFHDIGVEKRRTLARKALVIMARSLNGDWEQPVAYYFYGSTCCANIMKDLIFQAIIKLKSIGAAVHALITSTAPAFLRLSRQLGISVEHSFFLVNGEKIFYIFDVPRLIRATRNIFMNYEFRYREKRASWTDIELLFRRDGQMRIPLVPKLSVGHLEPSKRQKTETKYAVQVFSSSMAAGLSAHIASGEFPLKAIGTMEFVYTFDQLFDILNSSDSTKTNTKAFGQAFTGSTHEMCFLQQTLDFLKSIRVTDINGMCVRSMKSFDRWQITINAVIQLWNKLKEHQIPFLRTRRLNQEGIERVFRSIRRQSGNRVKPTPILFTRAFKNLVSKHFLEHSSEDNSAANARRMLKRIALSASSLQVDTVQPVTTQIALSVAATNYRNIDLRLPEKSAFKRVCEFLLNECLLTHANCDACIDYAAMENSFNKEASSSFSLYVSGLEDTFMLNFEKFSIEDNLGAQMLQFAQQVEYKPPCPDFPIAFLIKLFLRMRIYFTLSRHNKICKVVESRNSLNVIQL